MFSFAIIMYELFTMTLVSMVHHESGKPEEYEQLAYRVARGYREPLKSTWPPALRVGFLTFPFQIARTIDGASACVSDAWWFIGARIMCYCKPCFGCHIHAV